MRIIEDDPTFGLQVSQRHLDTGFSRATVNNDEVESPADPLDLSHIRCKVHAACDGLAGGHKRISRRACGHHVQVNTAAKPGVLAEEFIDNDGESWIMLD